MTMMLRFSGSAARAALFACLATFLSSCATVSTLPSPAASSSQTGMQDATRPYRQAIDFAGRLSLRYQGNDRQEALHGSFNWAQGPQETTVTLLSPLGQTLAVITDNASGATLTQSGQPVRTAADVDALTANTLGWPLPIAGLRNWLQGFATDRSGARFVATPATSEVQTKDGWQIQYSAWTEPDGASGQLLPRRIDLSRNTAQAGDISLRIVIDSWQVR
jgi:outer membrane lipoprotein LolB